MHKVVDVYVTTQAVAASERIVSHARQFPHHETCLACPLCKLGRADKFTVVVSAARQHAQYILCTNHCKQPGFWISIDSGDKQIAAGLQQVVTAFYDRRWIGNMLEHFQTGNYLE